MGRFALVNKTLIGVSVPALSFAVLLSFGCGAPRPYVHTLGPISLLGVVEINQVEGFLAERCTIDDRETCSDDDLYAGYLTWREKENRTYWKKRLSSLPCLSRERLAEEFEKYNLTRFTAEDRTVCWKGIRVNQVSRPVL